MIAAFTFVFGVSVEKSIHKMRGSFTREAPGFGRSALMLVACVLLAALLLAPFTFHQTGSRGPLGLAVAAAVCLIASFAAETVSVLLARIGQHLAGTLAGMGIRMFPPLVLCLALALSGQTGRQHLYFIFYLMAFYLVTLALETWIAVKRTAALASTTPNRVAES